MYECIHRQLWTFTTNLFNNSVEGRLFPLNWKKKITVIKEMKRWKKRYEQIKEFLVFLDFLLSTNRKYSRQHGWFPLEAECCSSARSAFNTFPVYSISFSFNVFSSCRIYLMAIRRVSTLLILLSFCFIGRWDLRMEKYEKFIFYSNFLREFFTVILSKIKL